MSNLKTNGSYLVRLVVRNARELLTRCTIRLILTLTNNSPSLFHPHPKILHPWPQKLNFSPRISFLTQNYSIEGCFNVGNSEHVKDVEAKIIVQVPDGKYKSLRHLCDFLWFLRLVIGCLRLYRGSQKYQLVPVKDRPAIISLSKLIRDHNSFCKLDFFTIFTKKHYFSQKIAFSSNFWAIFRKNQIVSWKLTIQS